MLEGQREALRGEFLNLARKNVQLVEEEIVQYWKFTRMGMGMNGPLLYIGKPGMRNVVHIKNVGLPTSVGERQKAQKSEPAERSGPRLRAA